jgi:serine/threonine protein kinase
VRLLVEEFRKTILRELDYRFEAENLVVLGQNLARVPRIIVPQPVTDYTTSRVLTMDYVAGTKITELSPVVLLEFDAANLADVLFEAYLHQVLADGFFHADPHPGNLLVTGDGQLAMIDLGMIARSRRACRTSSFSSCSRSARGAATRPPSTRSASASRETTSGARSSRGTCAISSPTTRNPRCATSRSAASSSR